ncbi:hypothetical protein CYMTET_51569 [Cymbomonas tetramitiformis]|uniref:Uncharacterized protein n=1 Tax=Cymbomonas tetramitiformis TaxID=36881 RepID=A0AAE0ERZ6_9CHLO|nr:hypothetical protein CYMTET_51569 [Cymbomonas tetramitiformis]
MEVLEGVVEECARGEARVKQAVDISLFGSLIFMAWMGEQPRWWMRKFVPWWKAMSAGEMRDWFVEGERYGTYVLGSVLTRITYVGKFWSGKRERLTKHFECVLQTDKAGGKKLYGGLRAKGMHNYFMLPQGVYKSKSDCNIDETLIIRRTQRLENTLNTVGVRRSNTSTHRRRHRRRRLVYDRGADGRKSMWTRAGAASYRDGRYSTVRTKGYNGGSLDQALRRLSKKERFVEGCWEVEYTAGGWSFSDWAKLKLRHGRSRVQLSSGTQELRGTLREMLPSLRRENAKLRFSTIEVSSADVWAEKEVKKLVRKPWHWKLAPKLCCDELVRVWQTASAVCVGKRLLRLRASLVRLTKKVHNFQIQTVCVAKFALPESVGESVLRSSLLQCIDLCYAVGATRNFVRSQQVAGGTHSAAKNRRRLEERE